MWAASSQPARNLTGLDIVNGNCQMAHPTFW